MLPSDINTYARAKYNATNDTFFTDLEIYYYIYQAELEIATEAPLVYETLNLVTFTATFGSSATSMTVTSGNASSLSIGMTLTADFTQPGAITVASGSSTTIQNIVGNTLTISPATLLANSGSGDTLTALPTVVNGTRNYSFPTNARIIKRIEYNVNGGQTVKLEPITFREDDALTLVNVASTTKGKPQFYTQFNGQLYFRPIPDNSLDTYNIFHFAEPVVPTASSTLELPTLFHMDLVDFVVKEMYAKDKDPQMYMLFDAKWQKSIQKIKTWGNRRKRGDAFTIVMNEDNLAVTLTGPV